MPSISINEPSDHPTESTDIVVTIETPEEPYICPQSQVEPPNPSSSTSPTTTKEEGVAKEEDSTAECRICLMSDDVNQLIKPCNCTGSVQYTHLKCLKLWIHETADVHCEICKSTYNSELLPELEPDLLIGLEERNRRNNRRGRQLDRVESMHSMDRMVAEQLRRQEEQRGNSRRFWMRALCFTVPLTILIVMLLFLGMNASDSAWASVLLRILAFALPTFIVLRIFFSCWDVARAGRGSAGHDDEGVRRGVGV